MANFFTDNLGTIAGVGLGLLGQRSSEKAAKQAAQAQLTVGQQAAEAAQFRPYSVTTGFGTGYFDTDKQVAGYELDPGLQAYRDALMSLGAQALPEQVDTQAQAQQYMSELQAMQAPMRAQEDVDLRQRMFGSGRLGLRLAGEAAGAGTGGGMYQPDVLGQQKARELANIAMAQQARQQAINELDAQIARGTGLFQTGLGVEQLGMTPLSLGGEFGGMASSAGAQQAQNLLQGGLGAAQANLAAGVGAANTLGGLGLGLMKYNQ